MESTVGILLLALLLGGYLGLGSKTVRRALGTRLPTGALRWLAAALLATLAGVAYGWVYLRTGTITAAAVTHAAVDWVWSAARWVTTYPTAAGGR